MKCRETTKKLRCLLDRPAHIIAGAILAGMLAATAVAKTNFPRSQTWQTIGRPDPYDLINPFSDALLNPASIYIQLGMRTEFRPQDYHGVYREVLSKDKERILNAAKKNFGKIFRVNGQGLVGLHYTHKKRPFYWEQLFHYNYGGIFRVDDPAGTTLNLIFYKFQGFSTTLNYTFNPTKLPANSPRAIGRPAHALNLTMRYGRIVFVDEPRYDVVEFFGRKLELNLKKHAWHFFFNIDLAYRYPIKLLKNTEIYLQLHDVALGYNFHVQQSFVGLKSFNFLQNKQAQAIYPYSWKIFAGIAPHFQGDYKRQQTLVAGTEIYFRPNLRLDVFIQDELYPGAALAYQGKYGSVRLYTYKQSFDKFGITEYRNYGLNLNFDYPWI